MKREYRRHLRLAVLAAALSFALLCAACGPERGDASGTWIAQGAEDGDVPVTLELAEDGHGVWESGMDAMDLRWSAREGEIWLHTRDGGVIVARREGETLAVTLPGTRPLTFRRP